MSKTDTALWLGLIGIVASGMVYFVLRDNQSDYWRVILTLLAILSPLVGVLLLGNKASWRDWFGSTPEPLLIFLGGATGLTVWGISWWLMDIANEQLFELVGAYHPNFLSLSTWSIHVVYTVVLLPVVGALLIFGLLRGRLEHTAPALQIGLMALYFAVLNMLITPQGLVALPGYGLLGLVIGFVVLRTGSFWVGAAAYGVFMYANLALLDDLAFRLGGKGYFETGWLGLVLFSGFVTLILTQVIRFRTSLPERKAQKISLIGWAALIGVLLMVLLYAASELDQRNEVGSATVSEIRS